MRQSFSWMLAWRYLNPLRAMLSWISVISLLGVALGVLVLVVVLAVMAGLEREVKSRLLGFTPHVLLEYDPFGTGPAPAVGWREIGDSLRGVGEVEAVTPHLQDNVILDHVGYQNPVIFRAIDTQDPAQVAALDAMLDKAGYPGSSADMGLDDRGVVSSLVADRFGISVGDTIRLYSTRNLREVKAAWEPVGRPPVREEFPESLAALEKLLGGAWKVPAGAKEEAPVAEVKAVYDGLRAVYEKPVRQPERDLVEEVLILLESAEKDESAGVYRFGEGSAAQAREVLNSLRSADVDKMDLEILKGLKEVVLPKDVEVAGIYQASQHVMTPDVFVPLPLGQELTGLGDAVQGVAVRVKDAYRAGLVRESLMAVVPEGWRAVTWMEQFQSWFSLIARERVMMYFALSFIILVSAFSMMAVMFTVTIQKRQEIGVMKALGATPGQVVRVFLWQGMVIGSAGALLGLAMGRLVIHYRAGIQAFLRDVMGFDPFPAAFHGFSTIPAHINPWEHLWIGLAAFGLCAMAALVPAVPAARGDAAKALRSL